MRPIAESRLDSRYSSYLFTKSNIQSQIRCWFITSRGISGSTGNELLVCLTNALLRIPVMWALDSGDVGRRRSEATLAVFYTGQAAHMKQEKGKTSIR
jgi:hypothetical protein